MTSHNRTPIDILTAPSITRVVVEGTESYGGRAERRRAAGVNKESYSRVLGPTLAVAAARAAKQRKLNAQIRSRRKLKADAEENQAL